MLFSGGNDTDVHPISAQKAPGWPGGRAPPPCLSLLKGSASGKSRRLPGLILSGHGIPQGAKPGTAPTRGSCPFGAGLSAGLRPVFVCSCGVPLKGRGEEGVEMSGTRNCFLTVFLGSLSGTVQCLEEEPCPQRGREQGHERLFACAKNPQARPLTGRTCGAHGDQLKVKPSPQCFSQDLRTVPRISWLGCGMTTKIVSLAV